MTNASAKTSNKTSPKKRSRWLWLLLILVLIFVVLGVLRNRAGGVSQRRAAAETVQTITLTPEIYTLTVTGPGSLSPLQSRDVVPQITGTVAKVVTEGERVTAGQTLVELDRSSFERAVRDAEVSLEQARAQRESSASTQADSSTSLQESIANAQRTISNAERDVQIKQTDLELKQRLAAAGSESNEAVRLAQNDYDTAVATLEEARLNLQTLQESQTYRGSSNEQDLRSADLSIQAAELALERANDDLAKTIIVAPFDGVISDVLVKQGSPVTTATTLLSMIDDTKMELAAEIDETQIPQIAIGQSATVTLEAVEGQTFEGRVIGVAPTARIEQNIPIFDVTILLNNPEDRLRSGMSAEADITVGEIQNTVSVPTRAVQREGDNSSVQVQLADGTISTRPVNVIDTEGFDSILETDLDAGTRIVIPSATTNSRPQGEGGGGLFGR
ncbi:MAG: efflux RND transporter periplasmic adaptor subunit [Trueperaceae bacterium]